MWPIVFAFSFLLSMITSGVVKPDVHESTISTSANSICKTFSAFFNSVSFLNFILFFDRNILFLITYHFVTFFLSLFYIGYKIFNFLISTILWKLSLLPFIYFIIFLFYPLNNFYFFFFSYKLFVTLTL